MRLEWTALALADLREGLDYIASENPQAAQTVAQRILDAVRLLTQQPMMGRVGHVDGTREWPVARTRYLIVCRLVPDALEILLLWHTSRDWQNLPAQ